ncbi:MAG: hypothetical protein K6E18_09665 [Lachnospiraceae bacterium]|nr:hypothetical protein [Lachnospiraceae bacterium]
MKRFQLAAYLFCMAVFLVSCGRKETIDGKWVMVRQEFSDGTKLKGDKLGAYECYEIANGQASYTCRADAIGEKSFDMTVEEMPQGEYQFKISDRLVFSTGRIEGKYLVFTF